MGLRKELFQFNIRNWVFWPPFGLLIFAVFLSIASPESFVALFQKVQNFILTNFSIGFSWLSFLMTLLSILVFLSPLGSWKIGGKEAKPRLNRLSWFAIVLCTTIATGILFWGSAEPLSHFLYPPTFKEISPQSDGAANFALGALFYHWGFTPYAIYAIPALTFALIFYSRKTNFSISLSLLPILGSKPSQFAIRLIDGVSLFALAAGMAASLGAGVLSLSGGFLNFFPSWNTDLASGFIILIILLTFVISSTTGIEKGIKNLSLINLFFFFLIAILFIVLGEKSGIINSLSSSFQSYFVNFFDLSLQLNGAGNQWTFDWSTFNLAMWVAWAPVTALFLGKIALGRTVREFLLFNWLLPALFCLIWMGIFGGTTLDFAILKPDFYKNLFEVSGPESIIYQVFKDMGHFKLFAQLYILAIFISYVTAADSSTDALASLSMKRANDDPFKSDTNLKILWGTLIAFLAWIMITFSGIDGVRMLSVMGGLPALFFLLLVSVSLILVLASPSKYLKP